MNRYRSILNEVKKAVIGKDDQLEKILTAILARGHILLEDIPGVGKTTMARAFAAAMSLQTRRMQFTVDVLPSDVIGFMAIDHDSGEPKLHPGAIFCNIFLADEINRTSSRTQAALLEVMEENRITVDGVTYPAKSPFIVIATQNPAGSAGTQLLPDSQLERFMIRLHSGYPDTESEIRILKSKEASSAEVQPAAAAEDIIDMQEQCQKVYVHDDLYRYIVELVQATRVHASIASGASPRAGIALAAAARVRAWTQGRDYIVPEDILFMFHEIMGHRITLKGENGHDAGAAGAILDEILRKTAQPLL